MSPIFVMLWREVPLPRCCISKGAEAIGADLDALYVLHQAGLRTLGPVWSRPNVFAYGVPFRFPSTPDIGPGLTPAGENSSAPATSSRS